LKLREAYILKNTLPLGGVSADVLWGKKYKKTKRKRGKCTRRRKGKENEKRVKYLQNREELGQKGHDGNR
jgi:hypothetical protein